MKTRTISAGQMSCLFFTFLTGSAVINIPGPLFGFANNGAWLSLLISGTFGLISLTCILFLHEKFPGMTFIDYSKKTIGTWITALMSVPFVLLLFHMASGIVLDVGLFMTNSMMRSTPMIVFNGFIFALIALTVRAGIEVMARMFTLLVLVMVFFVVIVLLLAIPDYKPNMLLPIMPEGIKPILQGAYFTFGFPYAEVFLFAMILPFTTKDSAQKKGLKKMMYLALLLNILFLVLSVLCASMVFGPTVADTKFSMYMVARMIDIQEIIQRIESVIGMSLIAGSYMKAAIALFVLNTTLCRLFRLKDDQLLIFPLALVNLFLSITLYDGEIQWNDIVSNTWPLWNAVANFIPLILLTLIALIRKDIGKKSRNG